MISSRSWSQASLQLATQCENLRILHLLLGDVPGAKKQYAYILQLESIVKGAVDAMTLHGLLVRCTA